MRRLLIHVLNRNFTQNLMKSKRKSKAEPNNWKEVLEKITKMRSTKTAPVDTKAPGKLPDPKATKTVYNYQTLVALMLSPQTRDEVCAVAMDRLKEHGLTPKKIKEMSQEELAGLINNVSFYNVKAKHIKKTTDILLEEHKGRVPDTLKELLKLPGVGRKVAHLALQLCYGKVEGIAVDTHVHRISNRLGWVKSRKPEETEKQLEEWLPKEWWARINGMLVGFGQETCKPVGPKCDICLAAELCPYGKAILKKAKPKKRSRKEVNKD
eukprot:TRINITY_DN12776_c0_g3_i1.p1 TRINITY_DN12776_c0_g3~~TRINITY_DN12776_c0_g3_i1.p1  ORF type:complete len:267 (+),score=74.95 TRINITY_DN12776_c0_g3_i1:60-860(+)